eukprot:NODE_1048_length_2635_cov_3.464115.p1 GENE.NODE_1048_length_2635_cov_3.464115~~NODE_1048_length_2635_cov_3.464115.p1  ORF type:complete len:447 (-),score=100.19 NODE_1048_length_2635_cov_3.464115:301-1641(-)
MLPRHIVVLAALSLPLQPTGKVDRRALREAPLAPEEVAEESEEPPLGIEETDWLAASAKEAQTQLRAALSAIICSITGVDPQLAEGECEDLAALGVDSMSAVPLAEALSRRMLNGEAVELEELYVYGTLSALSSYLLGRLRDHQQHQREGQVPLDDGTVHGTAMVTPRVERTATCVAPTAATLPATAPSAPAPARPTRLTRAEHQAKGGSAAAAALALPSAATMDPGMQGCRDGSIEVLRRLITAGQFSPATSLDRYGGSGLHWAAGAGHLETCNLLVDAFAAPGFADKKSGRCALHWCTRQGHVAVAEWLVTEHDQAVNVQTKDFTTPLQLAAWGGHVHTCAWLLDHGANLNHKNKWQCLPHHFSALAGSVGACAWLQSVGADLSQGNDRGHNALHKAAYGGHEEVCEWLQVCTPGPRLPAARPQWPLGSRPCAQGGVRRGGDVA